MKTFSFFLTNFDVLVGQSVGSFENKVYIKTKVPHDPSQIISGFAYFDTKIAIGSKSSTAQSQPGRNMSTRTKMTTSTKLSTNARICAHRGRYKIAPTALIMLLPIHLKCLLLILRRLAVVEHLEHRPLFCFRVLLLHRVDSLPIAAFDKVCSVLAHDIYFKSYHLATDTNQVDISTPLDLFVYS